MVSLHHYITEVGRIPLEGCDHDFRRMLIFLVSQASLYAKVLEHLVANREVTPAKGIIFMEDTQDSVGEDQALEQERSAAMEARQALMQELDILSANNDELKRKLNVAYQKIAKLRGGNSRAFGSPPKAIISHGTQVEAVMMRSSADQGIQVAVDDEACILHPCPHPILVSEAGEAGRSIPCNLGALSSTSEVNVEEDKIVRLAVDEATGSEEGQKRMQWSDRDHEDLL